MKTNSRLLAVIALLGSLQLAQAADITGKITLKGTPPPEKELPLDPNCGKLHTTKPKTRFYMAGAGGELADVFVYLKGAAKKGDAPAKPAVLDQLGCEYTPYISGLQTGQKLVVKNSDPVLHNVHPTPTAAGNKESNMAQLPKGKDLEFTFPTSEVMLRFKCDVHPWMFSYVGVLDHSFYAVSGKDGTFKIADVPPGKYTLVAYHRKTHGTTPGLTQEITVEGNKTADFTIELK